ncbi:SDR family oxidoreductase [Streptomyces thermolilacinus]|uniref:Polyketide synthase n=1 Tax=Streptomyces thermolilacinus SPC6 TaxID=1306406 RepID=A0A1D3DNX5_9ACTN|nr:SDR family NAD(P)-dependent oxidoreductase [Streptomyces thermolilacinus]OEJ94011.1 polyketide synthase [Streptomyces thermolilacinus SPC6]
MTNPAETYEKTFTGQEPFIAQHRSAGTGLLPAAVQLEMALVGVARRRPFAPLELTGVTFLRPLVIADRATAPVRLDVTAGTDRTRFELTTVVSGSRKPLSTGAGRFLPADARPPRPVAGHWPAGARDIAPERLYSGWEREGLQYGPDFRTVRALSVGDGGTARATLRSDAEPMPWYAHPLLVDGVFQVVSCALQDLTGTHGPYPMLPIGLERLALHADLSAPTDGVTVHVRRTSDDGAYATADALLLGPSDEVLAEFQGVRMRRTTSLTRATGTTPAVTTGAGADVTRTPAPAPVRREALPVSRIDWRPEEVGAGRREPASGTWVVLHHGRTDRLGTGVADRLRADGARVVEVAAGPAALPSGTPDPDRLTLDRRDDEAFRRLWDEVGDPVEGLVHLWNADGPSGGRRDEEEELGLGLYACLAALRTLGERQRKSRFLVVTRDGQPVADGDRPVPARAALWGLVRTAAIEYPGLRPRLVDLGGDPGELLPALVAELGDARGPVEVGYRDGVRHVPVRVRDRSAYAPPRPAGQGPVRPGGRYLVLGGHGGLGLEVAERFAREGAGVVALVSRSGGSRGSDERMAAITAHGCAAVSYSADITAPGALAALVERMRQEHGEVHGVVHAAGTLKDGLIRGATAEDVAAVMRPKADGVRELAAAVAGADLDFAVLFASVSGTFGNLGQGGYAAANAYLDGYAHAHGAPWLSVDWGLWGEVGMGTAVADQLRARGVRPLTTAEGLDALIAVLGAEQPARQLVIAHPDAGTEIVELDGAAAVAGSASAAPGHTDTAPGHTGAAPGHTDGAAEAGEGAGDVDRVADALAGFLAERLGVASLDREAPLSEYGMSSIMSVELSEELSRRWGVSLPATLFLEYGAFDELAEALTQRYGAAAALPKPTGDDDTAPDAEAATRATGSAESGEPVESAESIVPEGAARSGAGPATVPFAVPAVPERSRRPAPGGRDLDVAIVAVSGDLPGAPGGVAELWPLLRAGGHAFTDVPAERWDIEAHFEPRGPRMTGTYCRKGAFLSGADRFDPAFFGISVREAEEMDVQQKLLLEHAWAVRDDAGLAGRRDIGVFVGATYTHHRDTRGLETVGPHTALGSMNAVLANRISYALDLTGPSQTVDTLCSSSLVALQQAVAALRAGHCGAAIVAACQVGLTPWYYRSLSQLGALSETLPRPFDEHADGFLPGEGALAVLLKPLADAERDGDRIWGVVRGTAVNHGGRGSALPVPRSEAQAAVVRAALDDAGLAPADISLIETHGTATRLGDPIEIAALTEVFGDDPDRDGPCHLGAVKGNIGHLEPAAGLAGLVKALLCLRHGEIPPVAGFEKASSHLDLSSGPFEIPTEPRPWTSAGPRRFGVSSFGMGGTNAHVVVEEYLGGDRAGEAGGGPAAEGAHAAGTPGEHLLVLSGHTPEALLRRMADTRTLLRGETASGTRELCRSSAVGRDHRAYRVAVLGGTAEELGAGLDHALRLADRAAGTVVRGSAVVETAAGGLGVPALRYAEGKAVDWASVYPDPAVRRRPLPPYPFGAAPADAAPVATAAHPGLPGASAGAPGEDVAEAVRGLSRAHRVLGEETVPGAVPLALGLRAADEVRGVAFTGRGSGSHPLTSDLDEPGRTGPATFRHAGRIIARLTTGGSRTGPAPAALDLDALRADLGRSLAPAGLYAWFAAKGMELAAPLRSITEVHYGPRRVLARVGLAPGGSPLEAEATALDAAFQAMAVLTLADPEAPTGTFLPVSIDRAARWGDPAHTAYVLLDGAEPGAESVRRGDAALLAADGRVLVRLDGIEYRTVGGNTTGTGTVVGTAAGNAHATAGPADTAGAEGRGGAPGTAASAGPVARPARLAAAETAVVEVVRGALHDPRITATTSLSAVGIDSMLATAVAAELDERYGVPLSPTDVLDAADCRTLAAHVAELAPKDAFARPAAEAAAWDAEGPGRPTKPGGDPASAPTVEPERSERPERAEGTESATGTARTARAAADQAVYRAPLVGADAGGASADDVAVIGLAVALPGATDPDGLWQLLAESGDRIGPAPARRWGRYADGREPDVGGFLDGVEEFDARFFDFFPKQAEALDPQARWLLRTTWEALESAGLPPRGLSPSTGVFVGASYQHYKDYNLSPELDAPAGLGNHNAFLANRVSFFLDLHGPSMTIATLCSSSLVALHTAVRSIRAGECEQAVVAGVRVAMSPLHYIAMRNLRALSPSGRSRPFDSGADGFVPGEGVVTVVLKPLWAALRDGDRVRGVIRGSAVNHGGRTSGLTVPSSAAQSEVVSAALADAGVPVESIGLVEAHGTGTSLGDPIEVEGLTRAWRAVTDRSQFCAIGSLKSNVGHLEPAAGLAGLVKVLLSMERGVVPPSLHVGRPNDHIRFEDTPFYLADGVKEGPRPESGPRRGAVSAFGMGGVNAHVIVEEPPPAPDREVLVPESFVVRVSGADEGAVRTLAAAYADRFDAARDAVETADLCHTANTGRSPLEFQSAVPGRSAAELAAALRSVADGTLPVARVDIDLTADAAAALSGTTAAPGRPVGAAALASAGYAHIDWAGLSAVGARVTDLPTYPFAGTPFWRGPDEADSPEHAETPAGGGQPGTAAVRVGWRARALPPAASGGPATVSLAAADPGIGEALAGLLRDRGVTVVAPGTPADAALVVGARDSRDADPSELSSFWAELSGLMRALPQGSGVLWASFGGAGIHPGGQGGHGGPDPVRAATAMAVRAAGAEGRRPTAVVHLDPADPAGAQAAHLAAELAALTSGTPDAATDAGTTVAAYRQGVRYVPETVPAPPRRPYSLPAEGYCLVTGGLGAVGLRLTERLIARGARRVAVVGRSALDATRARALRGLAGGGAEVEYLPCDVSDPAALAAVADRLGRRWGRLVGVVHASGGVNPFGAMHRRPWSDAEKVLAPKVAGSLHVVRLAKEQRADFAVLVSSIAGTQALAGRGLVDYSLANAFQLALAEREDDEVTAVTAHAWPNWTGIGMKAGDTFSAAYSIGAEEALDAFFGHLRSGGAVVFPGTSPAPARTEPAPAAQPAQAFPASQPSPVTPATPAARAESPVAGPRGAGARRDTTAMRARVRDAFLHVLGEDPGDRPLQGLGLDSLMIAELTTALERGGGPAVDPSLLMRARTADDIAAELAVLPDPAVPADLPASPGPARAFAPDHDGAAASTLSALLRPLLDRDGQRGAVPS